MSNTKIMVPGFFLVDEEEGTRNDALSPLPGYAWKLTAGKPRVEIVGDQLWIAVEQEELAVGTFDNPTRAAAHLGVIAATFPRGAYRYDEDTLTLFAKQTYLAAMLKLIEQVEELIDSASEPA